MGFQLPTNWWSLDFWLLSTVGTIQIIYTQENFQHPIGLVFSICSPWWVIIGVMFLFSVGFQAFDLFGEFNENPSEM